MTVEAAAQMPQVDRAAASAVAVQVRRERAVLKAQLREGRRRHQDVLVEAKGRADCVAAGLRVTDFLLTLPFVGQVKLEAILGQLAISPRKRLGGLGQRQAKDLWDFLDRWLARHPIDALTSRIE